MSVRHLAEQIGADERTLRRAVAQGTIRGTRPGARRLEVSDAEVAYLRAHWERLARLRAALRTEPNVRLALLFGSAARGDERPDSDVDLLVDLRDASWDGRQGLVARLEQVAGTPVDLLVLDRVRDHAALLARVVEDGRVLVDRGDAWPQLRGRLAALRRAARAQDAEQAERAEAALEELLLA